MPLPFVKPPELIGRFAVVKPWPEVQAAEDENIARLQITARSLGLECVVVDPEGLRLDPPHQRVSECDVDFVISLHFETPKAYNAFSFVALWNPVRFFKDWGYRRHSRHLLTHDDFLSCSSTWADDHVRRLIAGDPTRAPVCFNLYHSLSEPILPPALGERKIFYAGINWEKLDKRKKGRHQDLLKALDQERLLRIHGPRLFQGVNVWEGYQGYVGPVPFDGVSMVRAIAQAGICLVLSSDAHKESELMSNRLFEALAAGAVIICDENPFARRHFGEHLLYIDASEPLPAVHRQIKAHWDWIQRHPDQALAKAAAAQEVFKSRFALDRSLAALYEQLPARKNHLRSLCVPRDATQPVRLLLLLPEYSAPALEALLESARTQDHPACQATLLLDEGDYHRCRTEIDDRLAGLNGALKLYLTQFCERRPDGSCRKRLLLGRVLAPVLEALPPDTLFLVCAPNERLFSNHVSLLLQALQDQPAHDFAFAPVVFRHVRARKPTYELCGELNLKRNAHLPTGFARFLFRRAALTADQFDTMRYLDLRALAPLVCAAKGQCAPRATLLARIQEPFVTGELLDPAFEQEIVLDRLPAEVPVEDLGYVKPIGAHALSLAGAQAPAATTFQGFIQQLRQRPQPNEPAARALERLRHALVYHPCYQESDLAAAETAVVSALQYELDGRAHEILDADQCDTLLAYCLGLCFERARRTLEALRAFNRALANATDEHPAQYWIRVAMKLADIALRRGETRLARQLLQSVVLRMQPSHPQALALLEKVGTDRRAVPPSRNGQTTAPPANHPGAPASAGSNRNLPGTVEPLLPPECGVPGAGGAPASAGSSRHLPGTVEPLLPRECGVPGAVARCAPEALPLVSAIVSTYNSERFLRGCLEDLERQTIADQLEIIVVDSGSQQNERAIVQEFQRQHPNIRYLRTDKREPLYAAWNRGIQAARGKYITNANTDDRHRPDAFEVLAHALDHAPDAALAYADCLVTRTENETFETARPVGHYKWLDFNPLDLLQKGCFVGPQPLWRRQLHQTHGWFDEAFVSAGDYEFWLRLATRHKFLHVKQTLGLYLESPNSIEHTTQDRAQKEVAEARRRYAPAILGSGSLPLPAEAGAPLAPGTPHSCGSDSSLAHGKSHPLPDEPDIPKHPHPPNSQLSPAHAAWAGLNSQLLKLGCLHEAKTCLGRKQYRRAWESVLTALNVRPFHPEAWLLLAEIAQAAGDSAQAKTCAEQAKRLVPAWKAPQKFLRSWQPTKAPPREPLTPLPLPSPGLPPKLSVCLIAKDEERFLPRCLDSVRPVAHQIIVVDTGSTDRTVEIAKAHGAEVHACPWTDDFSAARNAALEHATGDWILILDADEELTDPAQLRQELQAPDTMAYRLPIVDAGKETAGCNYVPRLFRNAPGLYFTGRVHEQIFPSLEACRKEWGLENRLGATTLRHYGYSPDLVRDRAKVARNLRLLQLALAESPQDPNLFMNYGLELVRDGQLSAGLDQYRQAVALLGAQPNPVPELRETLLTQFSTHLLAAKEFDEVITLLTSPLARAGSLTASLHYAQGLALLERKRFAEGAEQMRQCLEKRRQPTLTPVNPDIHTAAPGHCLARCLVALTQGDAADQVFRQTLAEHPSALPLQLDYARFQAERGQPLEAFQRLHQLLSEDAGQPEIWRVGAELALGNPQLFEFACDWTAEAIRLLPEDPQLQMLRAEALLLNRQAAQALPLLDRPSAQTHPLHACKLAACRVLAGQSEPPVAPADESAVSQAFLQWYRHLVHIGATEFLLDLNTRIKPLSAILPSAARILQSAIAQVGQA